MIGTKKVLNQWHKSVGGGFAKVPAGLQYQKLMINQVVQELPLLRDPGRCWWPCHYGSWPGQFQWSDACGKPTAQGRIGLKSLRCAINTLVVSTADCERAFSCMNETLTAIRNSLAVDTLSSLMFMSVCGPPMSAFKPEQYVTSWLCKHVSADDSQARARSTVQLTSSDMSCIWKLV